MSNWNDERLKYRIVELATGCYYEDGSIDETDIEEAKRLIDQMHNIDYVEKPTKRISCYHMDTLLAELAQMDYLYGGKINTELIRYVIQKGANVNHDIQDGFNCLFYTVEVLDIDATKVLLEGDADPNCISEYNSILDWVGWGLYHSRNEEEKNKALEIIELLKSYGAKTYDELELTKTGKAQKDFGVKPQQVKNEL